MSFWYYVGMSKAVKTAKKRVTEAQAALKKAEAEAREAGAEDKAREAEEQLRTLNRTLYDLAAEFDLFDDPKVSQVRKDLGMLQDVFALRFFGTRERVQKLIQLDPDYWDFEGKFCKEPCSYTTDDNASHDIATWIFDCGLGRGCKPGEDGFRDEWGSAEKEQFADMRKRANELLGPVGEQGFLYWEDGRHDT